MNVDRTDRLIVLNAAGISAQVDIMQMANPTAEDVYVFALDISSGFITRLPEGDYECYIAASGNGTVTIPVISTRNGDSQPWIIDPQLPGMNAAIAGENLTITPDDNTSSDARSLGIRLHQSGSNGNFTLTAH